MTFSILKVINFKKIKVGCRGMFRTCECVPLKVSSSNFKLGNESPGIG